jgi:CRISPR system Cascade subunit CasD
MRPFLMLQLYGVFASWGEIAVGEVRGTAQHPTRSALLGLCAAALGIDRNDSDNHNLLSHSLGCAVRLDSIPLILRDYHTTQTVSAPDLKKKTIITRRDELHAVVPHDRKTILSQRDYCNDALYTVALWNTDVGRDAGYSLQTIQKALRQPTYHLYFGRKSCVPALPLHPHIVEAETLFDALCNVKFPQFEPVESHSIEDLLRRNNKEDGKEQEQYSIWWEDIDGIQSGIEETLVFTRRDQPISRTRWQFAERKEYHAVVSFPHNNAISNDEQAEQEYSAQEQSYFDEVI